MKWILVLEGKVN